MDHDNSIHAFPHQHATGMSLRDWFAGMALAEVPDPLVEADAPATARLAYAIADAMIARRKEPI